MPAITLQGEWRLALDRTDAGVAERWFAREIESERSATLPGSLAAQRLGDPVGAETSWTGTIFDRSYFTAPEYAPFRPPAPVKLPFWLTPDNAFVGAAWYQREIEIPAAWVGRRVVLTLERAHWQTCAWLDEHELGTCDSLSTPHRFELGVFDAARRHRLTLRVDNRLVVDVGENAHSVSDHTQGNWNGVVGAIELRATEQAWFEELQVYPNVVERSMRVRGRVESRGGAMPGRVALRCGERDMSAPVLPDGKFDTTVALAADAALWDEFSPVLHTLTARLPNGDERTVRFGLREVRRDGRQLLINGRPLFLRGTLDCALFPRTGYPPTDVAEWRRILGTIKSYGLNHVRFHSWCPPEAAFVAGDELGMYFQVEAATWPNAVAVLAFNSPRGIGDGDAVDAWTLAEGERILRAYGNHPSFLLFAAGNEPGGPHHREYLSQWVQAMRALDPRHLYTGAAGWPELAENDFHVSPESRAHQWGDGLASRLNATPPATTADYRASVGKRTAPLISHEIGQWCSYPTVDAAKYTGHLRPGNHQIFARWASEHGLAERGEAFARAAGRLQVACYKEEIEAQLRTPGLGGFQLLGLQDFAGQGTAPVGVLDHFWEPKGYTNAAEFRRFCGPTVLLARLPRRVLTVGETLEATVEIAHFGPRPLAVARICWRLEGERGDLVARGQFAPRPVPLGNGIAAGEIRVPLGSVQGAGKLRLIVGLADTAIENDWELWVYPANGAVETPVGVHLARGFDERTERVLRDGGRAVIFAGRGQARGDARGRVEVGFTPIFWNTACTQRQAPHTLGITCDPKHPALAAFCTEAHSNWQWWSVLQESDALILDALPREVQPIVEVIDDWYTARRLGLIFEARVGQGKLLVCGVDLERGGATDPVVRQLRASLLGYAASSRFQPTVEVASESVRGLFALEA